MKFLYENFFAILFTCTYKYNSALAKNKVKTDTPTAKKIDNLVGINIWNSFINKLNNNIYFATSNGAYILRLDN